MSKPKTKLAMGRGSSSAKLPGLMVAHEMRETGRVFGRNANMEVVFGTEEAKDESRKGQGPIANTNGKLMVLPEVPESVEYERGELEVLRGYVDHEAAHCRFTDMKQLSNKGDFFDEIVKYPWLMAMANGLEDVRIEAKHIDEYAGAKSHLGALWDQTLNEFVDTQQGNPDIQEMAAVLPFAVAALGRERNQYGYDRTSDFRKMIDPKIIAEADRLVDELAKCKSTGDVLRLANETMIKHGFTWERPPEEQEAMRRAGEASQDGEDGDTQATKGSGKPGKGDGNSESDDGEGAADGNADGEGQGSGEKGGEKGGSGPAEDQGPGDGPNEMSDEKGQSQAGGWGGGASGGGALGTKRNNKASPGQKVKPFDPNAEQAAKKIIAEKENELERSGKRNYVASGRKYDVWASLYAPSLNDKKQANTADQKLLAKANRKLMTSADAARRTNAYEHIRRDTAKATNRMRKTLEQALQAKRDRVWQGGYEEGMLDPRALSRAMTGRSNIYRRKTDAEDFDTCVLVVVDASGSMSDPGKADTAQQTLIAFGEVFDRLGIPFGVVAFNNWAAGSSEVAKAAWEAVHRMQKGARSDSSVRAARDKARRIYGRFEPQSMWELKAMEQPMRTAKHSLAAYSDLVGAANSDGDCLLWAYERMLKDREEQKKVMIVLSDGQPCQTALTNQAQRLKDVCRYLESQVELFGIGLLSHAVTNFYENVAVCNDMEELASNVMRPLAKYLVGNSSKALSRMTAAEKKSRAL